ncbi:MAG: class I SAM-dependent methyltransferase [Patescibacteria group bacterium]|jgi:ubiquinone/menaquinone biosynthesis C-methylase UbiE|nr:methyltransferase domain-containing protein [bacterium]
MIENNFFQKKQEELIQEEELINKFKLRKQPIKYDDNDAINYTSNIEKDANLQTNPDNLIQKALKFLPQNLANKRVIDIGCGEGRWSRLFAQRGANVTGIDASSKMIEIAKERSKEFINKIELLQANIENLYNEEKRFDFAFSCYTFNNINNLNDIFQILNKILKNDGELIIATKLMDFSKSKNEKLKKYYLPIKSKSHTIYTYGNELKDYEQYSKNNNFKLIKSHLQETEDDFTNNELNEQNIKIFDAVLKYKKLQ